MELETVFRPLKIALETLPENERPSFDEFLKRKKILAQNIATTKQYFKGYKIIPAFLLESAEQQYDQWNPTKDDVLISSYPKTGTTWVSEIMRHLFYKGNDEMMKLASNITEPLTYLENFMPSIHEAYKKLPLTRRFYVTHLTSECINMDRVLRSGCKIICVLRNPKDQLVSWFNFAKTFPYNEQGEHEAIYPSKWDDFFETFITGQQPTSCKDGEWYPHHILSWYSYRNHKNVKFVYYEDFKMNPAQSIADLAEFVNSKRNKDEILEIVEDTSISKMKIKLSDLAPFMRKGVIGDWKNQFTVAQSETMDRKIKEILSGTDIKFTYE